mmetsp:Transcript_37204/g.59944  ORF Transcript_37204/g.59944 Transcript_37204/m.59944 type:complete len:219 (-) Transcript_37204:41-697(-)
MVKATSGGTRSKKGVSSSISSSSGRGSLSCLLLLPGPLDPGCALRAVSAGPRHRTPPCQRTPRGRLPKALRRPTPRHSTKVTAAAAAATPMLIMLGLSPSTPLLELTGNASASPPSDGGRRWGGGGAEGQLGQRSCAIWNASRPRPCTAAVATIAAAAAAAFTAPEDTFGFSGSAAASRCTASSSPSRSISAVATTNSASPTPSRSHRNTLARLPQKL